MDDIQALLDDHIVKAQTMRGSPYVKPFEAEMRTWEEKLVRMQVSRDRLRLAGSGGESQTVCFIMRDSAFWRLITMIKKKIKNQSLMLFQIYSKKIQIITRRRFARCASSAEDAQRAKRRLVIIWIFFEYI